MAVVGVVEGWRMICPFPVVPPVWNPKFTVGRPFWPSPMLTLKSPMAEISSSWPSVRISVASAETGSQRHIVTARLNNLTYMASDAARVWTGGVMFVEVMFPNIEILQKQLRIKGAGGLFRDRLPR